VQIVTEHSPERFQLQQLLLQHNIGCGICHADRLPWGPHPMLTGCRGCGATVPQARATLM
jgi:hypothetical protein